MAEPAVPPVAVVGCGVIGSGWIARLTLSGRPVRWFDPDPEAEGRLAEVTVRAGEAWTELGIAGRAAGACRRAASVAAAVEGAEVVIESLPERLELKRSVYRTIEANAGAEALIVSSTSGLRPTDLQAELARPDRFVVGHPFNPVYLLPLVEVVGGEATDPATIERAMVLFRSLAMHPLHVRVEIDAFIADRLLEALWREALWLVSDGVATTAEIDDAIRYGFGLRWAQMGLFETYRVAGGAGGMDHFIAQFGETLSWPWTKLVDTPDLTPELVATITEQSEAQSGHLTIDQLAAARDRNLVAILGALADRDWGAGQTIREQRASAGSGS